MKEKSVRESKTEKKNKENSVFVPDHGFRFKNPPQNSLRSKKMRGKEKREKILLNGTQRKNEIKRRLTNKHWQCKQKNKHCKTG